MLTIRSDDPGNQPVNPTQPANPQQQYQQPFMQQGPPMQPYIQQQPASSMAGTIGIVLGSVALLGVIGVGWYLSSQVNQVRSDMATTRDALLNQISEMRESSSVTSQTSKKTIDTLKEDLAHARAQAAQLSGQAKEDANKHADELAARIEKEQSAQNQRTSAAINEVKDSATAANTKVGEVSNEVGTVKTDLQSTKSDLEKTIAGLKSAQGDLGVQSGLIATNSKELAALRELGERNYVEFKVAKAKKNAPQRVGDIAIILKSTDPKHNKYTIDIVADDKTVEKKDRTVNEPVQLMLSRATQPYELVVNDVKKDLIVGYLAAPKVQQPRK